MNNYEKQKRILTERNERNKALRKRHKLFYIGFFVPIGVVLMLSLLVKSIPLPIDADVFGVICITAFVVWCLWIIVGIFLTRCPHCGGFLNRVPHHVKHCPHCATILKVYPDFEDSDFENLDL